MTEITVRDGGDSVVISVADDVAALTEEDKGGWVDGHVAARCGAWSGHYPAQFHETDFPSFAEALAELSSTLTGEAVLSSMDGYLDLTFTGDGLGHINVEGAAWDRPRWASHLQISFEIDQTYLPPLLAAVEEVIRNLSAARQE